MEVADSSFVMAISYTDDDESLDKAKKYLKDAITLYMKHRGPYNNSTIKAQVQFQVISVHIVVFCCISCKGNLDTTEIFHCRNSFIKLQFEIKSLVFSRSF